jgi:hypothetical protein
MGLTRYACPPTCRGRVVTPNRQHVAPYARRPGLFRAVEEAAFCCGPKQACSVNTYTSDISYSGITHALKEFPRTSWFHKWLQSGCICTVGYQSRRAPLGRTGRFSGTLHIFRMAIQAIPMCFLRRAQRSKIWQVTGLSCIHFAIMHAESYIHCTHSLKRDYMTAEGNMVMHISPP